MSRRVAWHFWAGSRPWPAGEILCGRLDLEAIRHSTTVLEHVTCRTCLAAVAARRSAAGRK